MSSTGSLVALAAVAALLLAGCGGSDTVGTSSGGSRSTPASATAAPAASQPSQIPYAVTGVVRDADGHPVHGVNVAMISLDEPANPVPELAVLTDEHGRYRWPASVPPGRYRLVVTAGQGTASTVVDVPAGGTASADLTLRPDRH